MPDEARTPSGYAALPSGVLAKIASLEHACRDLSTTLEASRRELQRLRIEQRDLAPNVAYDEFSANREAERLAFEGQRLADAIAAQVSTCDEQDKRLRAETRVVAACKQFLHDLPAGAQVRVVEGRPGDLDDIRQRIAATKVEIAQVALLPVPSDDLAGRITHYVDALAARARPVIRGIADGQALSVFYPVRDNADRVTLSGFAQHEGNPLLLLALMEPERLAERLYQIAVEGSLSSSERGARLNGLRERLTRLRYDEEASICAAISNGDDAGPDRIVAAVGRVAAGGRGIGSAGDLPVRFYRLLRRAGSRCSGELMGSHGPSVGPFGRCPDPTTAESPQPVSFRGVAGTFVPGRCLTPPFMKQATPLPSCGRSAMQRGCRARRRRCRSGLSRSSIMDRAVGRATALGWTFIRSGGPSPASPSPTAP